MPTELIQVGEDGSLSSVGDIATRLLQSGMSIGALRTNDVLRRDEWKQFDDRVIEIAQKRLRGVADLFAAGLTYNVPNPLGKTRIEWERVSDMDPAEIDMSGVTPGRSDRVTYDMQAVPLPITHKDFNLNIRNLHASRERGESLDTTQVELATRKVAESLETMLFKGNTRGFGGSTIYGYTTALNRNTFSLTENWGAAAAATDLGTHMLQDTLGMVKALAEDNMYGPYNMYVTLEAYINMQNDFKANSDKSIMQRLSEIDELQSIRVSEELVNTSNSEVILVQMTRDVVDWVDGMQPSLIQWETHGGMVTNFKVMALGVPRMKSTKSGQSGIVHAT